MSIRRRINGDLFCAAINEEKHGDSYIDDNMHHDLVVRGFIVTQPEPEHTKTGGQWWWNGEQPKNVTIEGW